ncbi:NUDIX domain-containing protein [Agrococcus lahaulensis]|nr:NUDIX domain-containing protein [Agrococcus lahaulensis]
MTFQQGKTSGLGDYPRPSVAVDTAVLTVAAGQLCVGVLHDPRSDRLRLPGTFLHESETLAVAVRRSLREKAGIQGVEPAQLHVFDAPGRDSRGWVVSVAHVAVVRADELGSLEPLPTDDARGLDFDHDEIVRLAVARLRAEYIEHADPRRILGEEFTITELRAVHEAVRGLPLQPDTFRRHMLPLLRDSGRLHRGSVGKPAALYRRA